ncbi:M1 family metalloprotease precursor [Flavobacterium saliperosum S13]|uniref:Aminopeptidase N n=2 Tax=Flavobacterium saliperosum TaxID=329186 RepID=A0A1G4W5B6_9FLAO|nr:M1 family aminopeptidase [Flavobacterium saliperosum]ESU22566.1 M1 family metalloprotease precursor [Flavobacterium saliperosum S13]SCX17014.1 Por secretion system C-terminal sorting domain-containing protein [Flavobacterium saliperosum]
MKKFALLFALLATCTGFSQTHDEDYHRMIEAEMKSASKTMNFRVNPNTQNYDVTYHKLEFTVDPAVYNIAGIVTTTFTALSDMTTVTFDLTNQLTVSSVMQGVTNLSFVQNANNELVITLPSTLTTGNSATVKITYSGAPASGEQAFITSSHVGTPILWTLSEPFGARDWWPCKQDLNDKVASIDVHITAPSTYTSVSNGLEQSQVINGGNKTTHFHHGYPIPAYLIAIAVTNYQIYNQQGGLGTVASPFFPIVNYIYPETAASTQTSLAVTPNIINLFETLVGPYPFRNEKYGHAQFGWGGGMEHTTVSFMGGWNRSLIAHEMAHQWFGDKVTCGTWKDIWLNEGLTEYMSGLVVENLDGVPNFVSWKNNKIGSITSQTGGNLYLTDAQALNVNTIFSSRISYDKGSMVTHMLRHKMGDAAFFQGLRNYLNDPALSYGYAVTPQFQNHMETVSGMDLDEFFNDWVYQQGYPTYTVNAQPWGAGQAKITINQTSSHVSVPFFEMPVPVRLTGAGGLTHDVVLDHTSNGQVFIVPVPFTPTGVQFDPNRNIISRNSTATLGTAAFELEQTISLYPNPTNDVITVQLPSDIQLEKAEIYNTLGQLVGTETKAGFNVSSLSNGIHIVRITTSQGVIHKNFIKK